MLNCSRRCLLKRSCCILKAASLNTVRRPFRSVVVAGNGKQNVSTFNHRTNCFMIRYRHESSYCDKLNPNFTIPHSVILDETDPLTSPEKKALERWKGKLSETKHFYEAVFVLGPMCSGKTHSIHELGCLKGGKGFAYVDTDEIMKGLEGYSDTLIDVFYLSARKVSIHLTDWLLDERMSFIAEGTCVKHDELKDYIVRLKEKGYKIKVKKIDGVPLDVVLDRAEKRISRRVPLDIIQEIYINSNIGIKKLWEINEKEHLFEEMTLQRLA